MRHITIMAAADAAPLAAHVACAALDALLATVWARTTAVPPEQITARRLEALRKALGDHVRVRVSFGSAPLNGETWRTVEHDHAGRAAVEEVFLQCGRRPHAQMPRWAREANGVVLGLGSSPADPWPFLAVPPPSVRYITNAEQLPGEGEVFRAEDGTRVTVTVPARATVDGRPRASAERYSTAGAPDAARVSWFGGRTLAETFERYAPPGLAASLEPGKSYNFILHDAEFQPYEQDSAGLWFLSAVNLATREVSLEPPPGCHGRDRVGVHPTDAVAAVRRMSAAGNGSKPGRPFYGITIESAEGTLFVESALYRRLRTTLYDADPMDREVGPECRLQMRGIRAYLRGGDLRASFAQYFPQLSGALYARLEAVVAHAAAHMVRLAGENFGRSAKEAPADDSEDARAGRQLGQYFFRTMKPRPDLFALLHPAAESSSRTARAFVAQPVHLDVITRAMCPQLDPVPQE